MVSTRTISIPAGEEYRFELEPGESLSVKLLSGTAELFGFELGHGIEYPFGDECEPTTLYQASETQVPSWLTLHLALEKLRLAAVPPSHFKPYVPPSRDGAEESPGPRVMVVGNEGEGKSTLVKTLVNWAVKGGRARREGAGVMLVNLDPSDGACTLPGTFSIMPITAPLPTTAPVVPFGVTPTSGPPVPFPPPSRPAPVVNADDDDGGAPRPLPQWTPNPNPLAFAPLTDALTFATLHTSLTKNATLVERILRRMGKALDARIEGGGESAAWKGGVVIDTPGAIVGKEARTLIKEAVRAFGVTVLVVMGNEKLNLEMTKLLSSNKTVTVLRVPESKGASEVDAAYRRRLLASQVKSYFYGGPAVSQGQLSPFTIIVKFEDLKIYRVGSGGVVVPSSALPIGAVRTVRETSLVRVDPEDPRALGELTNAVLAIPQSPWEGRRPKRAGSALPPPLGVKAEDEKKVGQEEEEEDEDEEPSEEEEGAAMGPVIGFLHLMSVDTASKKYTILSPLPGKLPRRVAVVGTVDWMDR